MNKRFLKPISDVFSRRHPPATVHEDLVSHTCRSRMLFLCRDLFSNKDREFSSGDHTAEFWAEIHHTLHTRLAEPSSPTIRTCRTLHRMHCDMSAPVLVSAVTQMRPVRNT